MLALILNSILWNVSYCWRHWMNCYIVGFGVLNTFRGSFHVCLYTVSFIVPWARQLSCDVSADAGFLCDRAAVLSGHDKRHFVAYIYEVSSIIKVPHDIRIQKQVIATLSGAGLFHWSVIIVQHNSRAHWCICLTLAGDRKFKKIEKIPARNTMGARFMASDELLLVAPLIAAF
jgi:hypothetical protein